MAKASTNPGCRRSKAYIAIMKVTAVTPNTVIAELATSTSRQTLRFWRC